MPGRRGGDEEAVEEPSSICRLRVPLPDSAWIAAFSRENPDVRIEVLGRLDVERGRSLTELRLHVPGPGPWRGAVRALPRVDEVEELGGGPTEVNLRVVHRTSGFVPIFRALHLIRRFPFTIEGGVASWVVIAPERKIRALLERVRAKAPAAALESIRQAGPAGTGDLLTPRQSELLRRSMAAGYFEVPRRLTLTELAGQLGMAVSSLSEALAIIEKKLLEKWPPP